MSEELIFNAIEKRVKYYDTEAKRAAKEIQDTLVTPLIVRIKELEALRDSISKIILPCMLGDPSVEIQNIHMMIDADLYQNMYADMMDDIDGRKDF